jgi:cell division protein FtsQ
MRRLRHLSFFLAAFVLSGGTIFVFFNHMGIFEISGIPVEMISSTNDSGRAQSQGAAERSLQKRLTSLLQDYRGKRVWEVDLVQVRAAIARDEWVKDVLISRTFLNEVRVLVRPKTVALIFVSKQNQFHPVVADGSFLAPLMASKRADVLTGLPDVPLLRGEIFVKDPARRLEAVKFISAQSERGPMGVANISEIGWSNEEGYTLTLIQPKIEVKLGEERVDLKALRVAQVLNYLSANNLKGRVIDANFSKKVLVRLRKGP